VRPAQPLGVGRDGLRQCGPALAAPPHLGVHETNRLSKAIGPVGGDQRDAVGAARAADELLEGRVEGVGGDALGLVLGQHAVLGVQPRAQGFGPQQARAEAVNRRYPGGVDGARVVALTRLEEAGADALAQLGGCLLGEGDREHPVDARPVLDHGANEPLDEDARLAAAGARVDEQRPVSALDRLALLRSQLGRRPCVERRRHGLRLRGDGLLVEREQRKRRHPCSSRQIDG
jgi:hypothetical protein